MEEQPDMVIVGAQDEAGNGIPKISNHVPGTASTTAQTAQGSVPMQSSVIVQTANTANVTVVETAVQTDLVMCSTISL